MDKQYNTLFKSKKPAIIGKLFRYKRHVVGK